MTATKSRTGPAPGGLLLGRKDLEDAALWRDMADHMIGMLRAGRVDVAARHHAAVIADQDLLERRRAWRQALPLQADRDKPAAVIAAGAEILGEHPDGQWRTPEAQVSTPPFSNSGGV